MKYIKSGNPYRERGVFHGKGYQPARPASGSPFEQAFFLVRDAACPRGDAVREACRIAEGCLGTRRRRRGRAVMPRLAAAFLTGAVAASVIWGIVLIF